jgi:hypothetical protein
MAQLMMIRALGYLLLWPLAALATVHSVEWLATLLV